MIVFLVQTPHTYTHAALTRADGAARIRCRTYDWLLRQRHVPPATYIFTDRERMDDWQLRVLSELYAHLAAAGAGYRVVNDPSRMKDRHALLRALHDTGINEFNAYAVMERARPARFPVFIRRGFDHGEPLTGLLETPDELTCALARLRAEREPEAGLLIVEYCAEPAADGLFRKLAAFRIGEQVFFYHTVHENRWITKYGAINSATRALYEDEYRMIRDNAFADSVRRAFDVAGIEYGRADFGLVGGRPQFYEINTNPHVQSPQPHPQPLRNRSQELAWEKYRAALAELAPPAHRGRHARRFRSTSLSAPARLRRLVFGPEVLR